MEGWDQRINLEMETKSTVSLGHAQVEMLARHVRGEVWWADEAGFPGQEVEGQSDPFPLFSSTWPCLPLVVATCTNS